MKLELLAPAKNRECGEAAVNHGADAVYIAGERFGAREAAGNSMADIEKLCAYARKYRVKTYLALNTILFDEELEEARRMIVEAYEVGCDAVIVQDMGLLEMDLPPVPLFASTQTDNCTPEKVAFLQDAGFSRVILARELSLNEIRAIGKSVSVELETFVHGSLCVSYSGRCHLSERLKGRSANRGCCAQMCRLPFDLCDADGTKLVEAGHLLSLKDLNMSAHLESLIDAGVSSFKIEGRLKDLSYVKNITAYYRTRLDGILEQSGKHVKASSGKVHLFFEPDPERTFSRGFTDYFAETRKGGLCAGTSKSVGKFCGTVVSSNRLSFTLDGSGCLPVNGDGICFFDADGNLSGTRVNSADGNRITPLSAEGIETGTAIFRNADRLFDKLLAGESATRKIHVRVRVEIRETETLVSAEDEDGITAELHFAHSADMARNSERMCAILLEQFRKTGGEIFEFYPECRSCNRFFSVAEINSWRRATVARLEALRAESCERRKTEIPPSTRRPANKATWVAENVSNSRAERFYRRHGVTRIERATETGAVPQKLMRNKYCIKFELGMCHVKQGAKPTGDLFLQSRDVKTKTKLKLHFDCTKCEMSVVQLRITNYELRLNQLRITNYELRLNQLRITNYELRPTSDV
jgi:putative protease